MPVPHNPPLGRGEGPCNYVAGWNMPGYLPTMEPEFFEHFDDAKRWLLNSMEDHEDDCACTSEDIAGQLSALREEANLESGPFTTPEIDGLVYWVEPTESES